MMTTLTPEIRVLNNRIIAVGTGKDFPKLGESKVCKCIDARSKSFEAEVE